MVSKEIQEIYDMQKWSDDELIEELSRPVEQPLSLFQTCVNREALCRILRYLSKE